MAQTASMEIPALGRPFHLGGLYDCRSEKVFPNATLWNPDILQKNIESEPKKVSNHAIIIEDSFQTKLDALNVDTSLKAGILCGLVSVSGSANYLKDRHTSNLQVRLALKYSSTSRLEQLNMMKLEAEKINHPNLVEDGSATHVVTGILYGADTFFVFNKDISKNEEKKAVLHAMEAVVNKMVYAPEEVEALNHGFVDKDILCCDFYGDLNLDKKPETLAEALEVYQKLVDDAFANEEYIVPKMVILHPLHVFDDSAAKLVKKIDTMLVDAIEEVVIGLQEVEVQTSDLIKEDVIAYFPGMKQNLCHFLNAVNNYTVQFKKHIFSVIPGIRAGNLKEDEIVQILDKHWNSIFSWDKLKSWLTLRRSECQLIGTHIAALKKHCIVQTPKELRSSTHCMGSGYVLCLMLQVDMDKNEFVSKMNSFLEPKYYKHEEGEAYVQSWIEDAKLTTHVNELVNNFQKFAEMNGKSSKAKLKLYVSSDVFQGQSADVMLHHLGKQKSFIPPSAPQKPVFSSCTQDSIILTDMCPAYGAKNIIAYEIAFRNVADAGHCWSIIILPSSDDSLYRVAGLQSGEMYVFKTRAICRFGYSDESEESLSMKTEKPLPPPRLALEIRNFSTLIQPGSPNIYKLPITVVEHDLVNKLKFCEVGHPLTRHITEKIVILLGCTGSGKTTVINGMANYVYGVQWKDDFRFKVITEEDEGACSQAFSQTSYITSYTFHYKPGSALPYTVTLIDTPGFGDTSGIKKDEEIVKQIKNLFEKRGRMSFDHLDAIGFVVQAPNARLTHTQQYIFDSILSVFGKDVVENVFILITFSDGGKPQVLDAIEIAEIPFKEFFKFNNSALFCENQIDEDNDENFDEMFWKIGLKSYKQFFNSLNLVASKSLQLTREVLRERETLEASIHGLQNLLRAGLNKLEELRKEEMIIKQHEADIEANKNFSYQMTVTKQKKVDLPPRTYVTNCLTCNFTCHYPCGIPEDKDKASCTAMSNGICCVCPGRCIWNVHVNNSYRFELYQEEETRTSEELKEKFYNATDAESKVHGMLDNLAGDFENIEQGVCAALLQIKQSANRLNEIAAKPNPLSVVDYIDILIKSEEKSAKPGWKERVDHLAEAKEKAKFLDSVTKDPDYDPWAEYKKQNTAKYEAPPEHENKNKKKKPWYKFW